MKHRRLRTLFAAALLSALLPFGSIAAAAQATRAPTTRSAARDAEAYAGWVRDLASPKMEGRGPDTAGIVKARDYLVRELKAAGTAGAFEGSFLQEFPIRLGVEVREQSLSVIGRDGRPVGEFKAKNDYSVLGFSASKAFEGPAVFVGYGVVNEEEEYDSYGDAGAKAPRGKTAIAFRYEPQDEEGRSKWTGEAGQWSPAAALFRKARLSEAHGASALLIVNPPGQADKELRTAAGTGFGRTVGIPVFHVSLDAFQRMLKLAGFEADEMVRRLKKRADAGKAGLQPLRGLRLSVRARLGSRKAVNHNVAGVVRGAGKLSDEVIIVGAHYDHLGYGEYGSRSGRRAIHPGADDNASGTAGVLLLARRLARAAKADARGARRTVVLALFAGEERGLIGSRHMAGHLDDLGIKPSQVVAMVNLDMIGRLENGPLHVFGVNTGSGLKELVEDALRETGRRARLIPGIGSSDQMSFHARRMPVLMFFTGLHADYHCPSDTADKIDAAGAVEVVDVVESTVWKLATAEEAVEFERTASSRGGAYLGVTPSNPGGAEIEGCLVGGVMESSPAGKAGLRAGDVIVAFGDKNIASLYDLIGAIRGCKPKDEVTLTVLRDGKKRKLTVTMGSR